MHYKTLTLLSKYKMLFIILYKNILKLLINLLLVFYVKARLSSNPRYGSFIS